ncbi:MAG: hypothetical protein MI743_12795 [Sneathiellales bacterium]|nr:hypothetical protein [Sneathiellales bacterium]
MNLKAVFFLPVMVLAGCAGDREQVKPADFLKNYNLAEPSITAMVHCSEHDCLTRTPISLEGKTWKKIYGLFEVSPASAAVERQLLAKAAGIYEQYAGKIAGTHKDQARTSVNSSRQLDCIDETLNTTMLFMVLEKQGLIRFHTLAGTVGRGEAFDWPHFALALAEKEGRQQFVLDSWFRPNGQPADILTLAEWKKGWNPPEFK